MRSSLLSSVALSLIPLLAIEPAIAGLSQRDPSVMPARPHQETFFHYQALNLRSLLVHPDPYPSAPQPACLIRRQAKSLASLMDRFPILQFFLPHFRSLLFKHFADDSGEDDAMELPAPGIRPGVGDEIPFEDIAKALGDSVKNIEAAVQALQIDSGTPHRAWVRRFNLTSPLYQDHFRMVWQSPLEAMRHLSEGFISQHRLDSQGRLILSVPAEMAGEIPAELDGQKIYEQSRRGYQEATVEWAWFPAMSSWLPVEVSFGGEQPSRTPTVLKTVVDLKHRSVQLVGAHLTRRWLKQMGPCLVYSRVRSSGHISLGYEKQASGRTQGKYDFEVKRGDILYQASVGQDGVPIQFHFLGEETPVDLRVAVRKDAHGNVIELLESHRFFQDVHLDLLASEAGSFWLQGLTVQRTHSSTQLRVGAHKLPGTTQVIEHIYNLPADYADRNAEVLIGQSGVPVYLKVDGKEGIFLKMLNVRSSEGETLEVIDSFHQAVYPSGILTALERARHLQGHVVLTRDSITPMGRHKEAFAVRAGDQNIYVPTELGGKYADRAAELSAEIVYDPFVSAEVLVPTRLRIGAYEPDDIFAYPGIRFKVAGEFMLERSNERAFTAVREISPGSGAKGSGHDIHEAVALGMMGYFAAVHYGLGWGMTLLGAGSVLWGISVMKPNRRQTSGWDISRWVNRRLTRSS